MELTKQMLRDGWELDKKLCEFMNRHLRWNDPSEKIEFFESNPMRAHGFLWGPKPIKDAMDRLGVEFVLRGHQVMTNGVRRFSNLPVATVFSSSCHNNKENFGAVLFVDPEKNAIVPIFIVNMNDKIETQEAFDEKLRMGWKVDDYSTPPEDITLTTKPQTPGNEKK